MGVEVERKFLVDRAVFRPPAGGTAIRQGYLARGEGVTVRVRLTRAPAGESGYLTVKGPGRAVRSEYEYPIPAADAAEMLDGMSLPGEVSKTRYEVEVAGRVFEVDVYAGRHAGLVTAEVELGSLDEEVTLPAWIEREVTDEPGWSNAELSDPGWVRPGLVGG